jgi:hypothetical protein
LQPRGFKSVILLTLAILDGRRKTLPSFDEEKRLGAGGVLETRGGEGRNNFRIVMDVKRTEWAWEGRERDAVMGDSRYEGENEVPGEEEDSGKEIEKKESEEEEEDSGAVREAAEVASRDKSLRRKIARKWAKKSTLDKYRSRD